MTNFAKAIQNIANGYTVDHLHHDERSVAIRPADEAGKFDVTFSDGEIEETYTLRNLTAKVADRLILTFFWGQRGDAETPTLEINQGDRSCVVIKATPTRVRIEYDMPNAGIMEGWWHCTRLGDTAYFTNH